MAKGNKKDKEDFKAWLLKFEQHIGKGVVVSLLIDKGEISFYSCIDKRRYIELADNEAEEPEVDLEKTKRLQAMSGFSKDYIG